MAPLATPPTPQARVPPRPVPPGFPAPAPRRREPLLLRTFALVPRSSPPPFPFPSPSPTRPDANAAPAPTPGRTRWHPAPPPRPRPTGPTTTTRPSPRPLGLPSLRRLHPTAAATLDAAGTSSAGESSSFALSGDGAARVTVSVTEEADGAQRIELSTHVPGRLLLHWGVEGGPGYHGGWRLPPDYCWPPGTYNYKLRALQTPFPAERDAEGRATLVLTLPAKERSDVLNFVLKEVRVPYFC